LQSGLSDSSHAAARILKWERVLIAPAFRGVASKDRIHELKVAGKCGIGEKSRIQEPESRIQKKRKTELACGLITLNSGF
jgi:hypothetical protein